LRGAVLREANMYRTETWNATIDRDELARAAGRKK
jgi:hypothetical protein